MRLDIGNNGSREMGIFSISGKPSELEKIKAIGVELEKHMSIEVVTEGCDDIEAIIEGGWDKDQWTEKEFRQFYKEAKTK